LSFEVVEKDLLGRVGKIFTQSGSIETPALLPVINPSIQLISPREMKNGFRVEAVITNAYILKKNLGEKVFSNDVHTLLDFEGPVMTDSGAYQLLIYKNVDMTPEEAVAIQEGLRSDISVVLDVPTGWDVSRGHAKWTVEETIKRAELTIRISKKKHTLWTGPIQGGRYLDLVKYSAERMAGMDFDIHALGSPTPVMEQYLFEVLFDMIYAAKSNIPANRPLHLFGAGHPMVFPLVVALGCDTFDSAAYALFARRDKYLSEGGTMSAGELEYLPCDCPICSSHTAKELRMTTKKDRELLLARHNLHVCLAEIKRIKQAILDGRLWDLLRSRSLSHPALGRAIKKFRQIQDELSSNTPSTKGKGLFILGEVDIYRPEVTTHVIKLRENYAKPEEAETLLLMPAPEKRPYHSFLTTSRPKAALLDQLSSGLLHLSFYSPVFGVVPSEIDEIYPLSQHELVDIGGKEAQDRMEKEIARYIEQNGYKTVILVHDAKRWTKTLIRSCALASSRSGKSFLLKTAADPWSEETLDSVCGLLEQRGEPR
jgi:7-cyano-7-deazaguanine tRNA-ribosyltransferase